MYSFLIVVHVIVSLLLVTVILLQSGKGGGLAAGFGGPSAGAEVFGGAGAAGFLEKATAVLAVIFMATSLSMAYLSSQPNSAMPLSGGPSTNRSGAEQVVHVNGSDQGGSNAGQNQAAKPSPATSSGAANSANSAKKAAAKPIEKAAPIKPKAAKPAKKAPAKAKAPAKTAPATQK